MRGLTETIAVTDVFCCGIAAIENLDGNCLRLHYYVTQSADDSSVREKVVVAKLIMPMSALAEAILKMIDAARGDVPSEAVKQMKGSLH